MRKIKTYKLFESVDDNLSEIETLFYDLVDNNYQVTIEKSSIFEHNGIVFITITKHFTATSENNHFYLTDVIDTLITADSYIKKELKLKIDSYYVRSIVNTRRELLILSNIEELQKYKFYPVSEIEISLGTKHENY